MHNSGANGTSDTNQRRYLKACPPMGTMAANCKNTETSVRRRLLSSSSDKLVLAYMQDNGHAGDKEQ
jgi:hypothetical protein